MELIFKVVVHFCADGTTSMVLDFTMKTLFELSTYLKIYTILGQSSIIIECLLQMTSFKAVQYHNRVSVADDII